jgi:membrane-bound lytic murein transglycosylase A
VTAVIFLYSLKQPLRNGDEAQTWEQVTNLYLEKISTLACLLLTAPPSLSQDNSSPTLDNKRLSNEPLQKVPTPASAKRCQPHNLGWDEQLWGDFGQPGDKEALLGSIDYSLRYLQTSEAAEAYQEYPVDGITRDRIFRSLLRFRQLVLSSSSAAELEAAVKREFVFYQSVGGDGRGTVLFTAYYEPIYAASRVPTAEYRYPIYRRPPDLSSWPSPTLPEKNWKGLMVCKGRRARYGGWNCSGCDRVWMPTLHKFKVLPDSC